MLRDVTANRQRQAIRDTFIGVLSHELRTPVTTIFAGSKVLARRRLDLPPETRQEIFADIVIESERLHRLVEDVIAMTRFGEDEGEIGTEPVLIQRVLPGRHPLGAGPLARRRPSSLDVPPGVPTAVARPDLRRAGRPQPPLERRQVRRPRGDGQGRRSRRRRSEITVTISDDGPGFPAEEADRLFELFFRSPNRRQRRPAPGSGCSSALA